MPNPKRRHSKQRKRKRRTHDKAEMPTISSCSHCGAATRYHRICPECGYYRGKQVIAKEVAG